VSQRIPTYVFSQDQISQAGLVAQLRQCSDIWVVDSADPDRAAVAVVATDTVDDRICQIIRGLQRNGIPRVILVVTEIDDAGVFAAVEAGVCGFCRRSEATSDRLVALVRSAERGDGALPPDLLGRLLDQVGRLQRQVLNPRGLSVRALDEREIAILRLVADGFDTPEIAASLCYSERTIKKVIHDVTIRLSLRNRTHAVAYALREGLL
jgi:DNA-binding NarL/FixJ family response regulator